MYRSIPNAKPIKVSGGFNSGIEYDEKEMAFALATFVLAHSHLANPGAIFYDDLPAIFFFIGLDAHEPGRSGESGRFTVTDIYEELALRIAEKNNKLPAYRTNLPGISRLANRKHTGGTKVCLGATEKKNVIFRNSCSARLTPVSYSVDGIHKT